MDILDDEREIADDVEDDYCEVRQEDDVNFNVTPYSDEMNLYNILLQVKSSAIQ